MDPPLVEDGETNRWFAHVQSISVRISPEITLLPLSGRPSETLRENEIRRGLPEL